MQREAHPSVEQTLAQIGGAKHFTKLDANSGYWQIELDPESAKLMTFITPFGRFCFNRLPFGITSASEHFQQQVRAIQQMKTPMTMSELRRFLGMINQQSKFSPNLADHTKPLRDLLSKKNQWSWGTSSSKRLSDSRVH